MSSSHDVAGRPHYYSRMAVEPDNENQLYFLTASYSESKDGGETLQVMRGYPRTAGGHTVGTPPQGDFHDMWIDPSNAERMLISNDGGVGISVDRGRTWLRVQLPNAQIYHVTTDRQVPYMVYGNRQDGPSFRGPSNSRVSGYGQMVSTLTRDQWTTVGGGESGWTVPDWSDPNIIWSGGTASGSIGGSLDRYDERSRQFRNVEVWPDTNEGYPAGELKYRFNWTFPIAMSPHDHSLVYVGSQYVHRTSDGGQSWQVISPDLTLNDKSKLGPSGGLTGDNIGPEYGGTLISIAESPKQAGVIWTGSNDGVVSVTRDGGKTWTNVSRNIPNLPPWGTIYTVEPSHYDPATAYITVDLHQQDNRDPYVFKTTDYGRTWKNLGGTLPHSALSYAHAIAEDPVQPGLLFVGLENGLYVSFNDGESWQPLQNNLPHAPVYGITVQPQFNDLVLATYGRGFWILDDITPLRQQGAVTAPRLFPPRPAYRFRGVAPTVAPAYDPTAGENPPYGADINYFLPAPASGEARITILDSSGQVVRTLRGSNDAGINRLWWDLRYAPGADIRLRTSPIYASWMKVPEQGRPAGGRIALLAPPGTYTIKLEAGGQELTAPLTVIKDPHSEASEGDIRAQFAFLQSVRDQVNQVGSMINQSELLRSQLQDLQGNSAVGATAAVLDAKLTDFEGNLYQLRISGGQDGMRWPAQLLEKLAHLASDLADTDYGPTAQELEVQQIYAKQIGDLQSRFRQLMSQDVAQFNGVLQQHNLPPLATSVPPRLRGGAPVNAAFPRLARAAAALLCAISLLGAQRPPAAHPAAPLPEGEAKPIVEKACVQCHTLDNITSHKLDHKGWENVLDNMAQLGAKIPPEQVDLIVDYLAKNFGKTKLPTGAPPAAVKQVVEINKASAPDLERSLGLTAGEAQALVSYRAKHGNFKSVEELQKVPGLSAQKIEDKKDVLVF
jgi:competence ComEA-like helix-hairpin-helix protein